MATSASPGAPSPPPSSPPPSALTTLATTVDSHTPSSTPSFLNDLLSPLLPPSLPAPAAPSPPSLPPIDAALQDLLTQLSLLSQDTASSLEQAIHEVGRTVPRLAYDLQFMRESASSLQASLVMVQDRVARQTDLELPPAAPAAGAAGESEAARTHRALDKLTHLDTLKTRLESARDILREAEAWSTLEAELTALLGSREYAKAGHRLREASRSMVVFQNTPAEWEERKRLLVSLENELEGAVGRALGEALGAGDVEGCRGFYEVFEDMEREEEFRGYYLKERGKAIAREWRDAVLVESGDTAGEAEGRRFASWLPGFYSTVLHTLTAEVDEIPLIFPPQLAPSVLAAFAQTTFDGLDPSFATRLTAAAEHHGADALLEVIRAWKVTEELGVAVQGLLDRMTFNTQGGTLSGGLEVDTPATAAAPHTASPPGVPSSSLSPSAPVAPAHRQSLSMARPPSHRASVSKRFSRAGAASAPTAVGMEWETTLYEPFLDLQSGYAGLEKRYLDSVLALSSSSSLAGAGAAASDGKGKDAARALVERASQVLAYADDAVERCAALTLGFGAVGLVSAVDGYLSGFLERERRAMLEVARSRGGAGGAGGGGGAKGEKDELDFEGLDYSTEDWGSFQAGLHVLEACREVWGKLGGFGGRLAAGVGRVEGVLKATKGGEGWDGKATTWGAVALLQQSTLNSAELHQLVARAAASTATATSTAKPAALLPRSSSALEGFTRAAQLHLQSIILSPLLSSLSAYPSLAIWSKADKPPRKGELQVPKFSLSPTDVISRVSEGLLDLLRVFEVWAGESGLAWSLGSLPFVEGLPLELPEGGGAPPRPETVLSMWISSLALTLLSHLTSTTLPAIAALTSAGQAQLQTDLAYLGNAVRALDVEWADLGRWEAAVGLDEAGWRREREGDEVVRQVGRMRGWRVQ